MKLTIIAATGGAGRELPARPLAAGHDITAVARNPGKLSRQVRAITTDLAAADLRGPGAAVRGADALRPRPALESPSRPVVLARRSHFFIALCHWMTGETRPM